MKRSIILVFVCASFWGCKGEVNINPGTIEGPDGRTEKPPGSIERDPTLDPDIPDDESCRFITPGESPFRRLSGAELNNTYQDLFPDHSIPMQSLPDDEMVGKFEANTNLSIDDAMAGQYQAAAENIALIATADIDALCSGNCPSYLHDLAYRAYRRTLTDDETVRITFLYQNNLNEFGEAMALQLSIEAILQSPYLLYRPEVGEDTGEEVVPLTSFELATRLSYFLGGTTPDRELLDAAASNDLLDRDVLEEHARRMLGTARTKDRINTVFIKWFGLENIETIETPRFSEEQKQLMKMETETFIDHVLWNDDATLGTLLTADYAFVSAQNDYLYDVQIDAESGVEEVTLPANRRGILSHPSFLAEYAQGNAIVHRGKFIKDAFLCVATADVPDELEMLPTFEGESERSKAEKRINASEEGCATCHYVVDNLGLVFDRYNANGVYISEDADGNPLTSLGGIYSVDEATDGPVDGIPELAAKLAESESVRSCVTQNFLGYAMARGIGVDDTCSVLTMQLALDNSDGSLTEMLVSVVKTDAFRYRQQLEVAQ